MLQERLTDLILGEDGQPVSHDLQTLIGRVLGEIESWLNQGEGAMTFKAQINLSNMAYTDQKQHMQSIFMHGITYLSNQLHPFHLQLELERKIFTSELSLFTPKCD